MTIHPKDGWVGGYPDSLVHRNTLTPFPSLYSALLSAALFVAPEFNLFSISPLIYLLFVPRWTYEVPDCLLHRNEYMPSLSRSWSCVPSSITRPPSITNILSALRIVLSLSSREEPHAGQEQ